MAFGVLQAVMPPLSGQKILHPFFERSNSGISPCAGEQPEASSSLVSSAARASVEVFPKSPNQDCSTASLQPNSFQEHVVRDEPALAQSNGSFAHAGEKVRRNEEPVSDPQPKMRNETQILNGLKSLVMPNPPKRRKLSSCTHTSQNTVINQTPGPVSEAPSESHERLGNELEKAGSRQSSYTLPSSGPTLEDGQNSHSQGISRDKIDTEAHKCSHDADAFEPGATSREESPSPASLANVKGVLRLNGAGGLGSSAIVNAKTHQFDDGGSPGQVKSNTKTKAIVLRYAQSDKARRTLIGEKIGQIQQMPSCLETRPHGSHSHSHATEASKPTHPFFLGKVARQEQGRGVIESEQQKTDPASPAKQNKFIMSFSTPGKMRYQANKRVDHHVPEIHGYHQPHFRTAIYVPGTFEAPWPANGIVNVGNPRQLNNSESSRSSTTAGRLKWKSKATDITSRENILHSFSSRLFSSRDQNPSSDDNCSQRHPMRLLISGDELQTRVLANLKVASGNAQILGHQALASLFSKIGSSISPFDKGECECITWAQKYGPDSTAQVLQPEREMKVLRTWLASQAVAIVDSGSLKKVKPRKERRRQKKKRQRLANELDDFIVDSDDDETTSMCDLSDGEAFAGSIFDALPRSRIRDSGDEYVRSANSVLISGPHGCGKTAAALAVAKELGFEVFEIGPGNRRSGKDILEKVGDMALNHQVSKSDANSENERAPQDNNLGQARSDYQGTLTSFVTAQPNQKLPLKVKTDPESLASRPVKQPAHLKQSLILLEEVDVLFEQDKQFWETVLDLAMQSKRPIIMTCSDENISPSRGNLAVGYLLLLAAAEGHLIPYEAVSALYKVRGSDLRASIFDLDFWCQMAVGDRKGGMQWYHDKWPPGTGLDENGHPMRIVSENTMVLGMGVLDQLVTNHEDLSTTSERLALDAWAEWNFDPANLSQNPLRDLFSKDETSANGPVTPSRLNSLLCFDRLSELKSAVDVFSSVDVPWVPKAYQILDSTQPPMLEVQKADFVQGRPLLQADSKIDYPQFDTQIATYVHLRIREEIYKLRLNHVPDEWGISFSLHIREQLLEGILDQHDTSQAQLGKVPPRVAFFMAFKALQENTHALPSISSFDQNLSVVAEDLAPYIRSIAAYDQGLERRREMLSSVESGPGCAKPSRRTRVSRSAMEGSQRATTRRERWFGKHMDLEHASKTAGSGWQQRDGYDSLEKSNDSPRVHENLGRAMSD